MSRTVAILANPAHEDAARLAAETAACALANATPRPADAPVMSAVVIAAA